MRTRETVTGGFTDYNLRYNSYRNSCSGPWIYNPSGDSVSYSGTQQTKTIIDCPTPGFYSLLEAGGFLPLNPVDIKTTRETIVPGTGNHYSAWNGSCYLDWNQGPAAFRDPAYLLPPGPDASILDSVVTSAMAEARSATFDALTFAAEFAKTVELVASNYRQINKLAQKAARWAVSRRRGRNGVTPAQLWDLFNSKWLEYRYGWRPLLFDAEDALQAFCERTHKGDIRNGKARFNADITNSTSYTTVDGPVTVMGSRVLTGSRVYRGAAYAGIGDLSVKYGIDPLVTGWELIPYSFVIDWFLDVGTWIKAVSPFSGTSFLGSMASVKDTYTSRTEWILSWSSSSMTGIFTGASSEIEVQHYTRFPHSVGITPSWNPRPLNLRIVDLVALVVQGNTGVNRMLHN